MKIMTYDEARYERGHLKILEERKKQPFSLSQLQFRRIEPPALEEEIKALQDYIGHPLPELYKEICRHFNGGKPKLKCFEDIDGRVDKNWFFYRLTSDREKGFWKIIENFSSELKKEGLPFAHDSLGLNIFYFKWVNDKVEVWRLLYGSSRMSFLVTMTTRMKMKPLIITMY